MNWTEVLAKLFGSLAGASLVITSKKMTKRQRLFAVATSVISGTMFNFLARELLNTYVFEKEFFLADRLDHVVSTSVIASVVGYLFFKILFGIDWLAIIHSKLLKK